MIDLSSIDGLQAFIDVNPMACIATDPRQPDNPVIAVNAGFSALTGYPAEEILGRNCRFLAGPDTETGARSRLRRAVEQGESVAVELLNYRRDGSPFRNAVMIAPLFDATGQLRYFLGSQMEVEPGRVLERRNIARDRVAVLSERQLAVLVRMAKGMRYSQIGREMGINEATVKMHRAALVKRLMCQTSAEAIRIAVEAGI